MQHHLRDESQVLDTGYGIGPNDSWGGGRTVTSEEGNPYSAIKENIPGIEVENEELIEKLSSKVILESAAQFEYPKLSVGVLSGRCGR